MKLEGGCYCGALRYVAEGEPMMKFRTAAAEAVCACSPDGAQRNPAS